MLTSIDLLSTALHSMQTGLVIVQIAFDRDSALPSAYFPIMYANESFCRMFGKASLDGLLQCDIRSLVARGIEGENADISSQEAFSDALQLGIAQTLTLHIQNSDSSRFYAQVQLSPTSENSTQPTHIICTFTDITDFVETNDALTEEKERLEKHITTRTNELQEFIDEIRNELQQRRILEAELRLAEQRYRSLAKNFPNGVVILLARDMNCILCEGSLSERIPRNQGHDGQMYLGDEILNTTKASIDEAFRGEQRSFEISLGDQPFLVQTVPVLGLNNRIDAVLMVLQDISDFKARQEWEQEREMTALKYRFVTIASHELRTPLAGMMLSSGILRRYWDTTSDKEKHESVLDIIAGLDRMSKLVDDILFVGKSEAGKLPYAPQKFDFVSLCNEYVHECEKGIGINHKTTRNLPSEPLEIYADKKLIQLVVNNLLTNAYKYSPPHSLVQISLEKSSDAVLLRVQDSGIGIPAEDIPNLFKSFHRGKNVGEIQGTGLGLAMVERAIEQHGGTIQVDSIEGQGTTFTVMLPLNQS